MPTDPRRRRRGLGGILLVLALGAAVVAGVGLLFDRGLGPLPDPEGCTVEVGGTVVDLSTEQAENATTISAVAVRRGLPARAVSIALATAFQESKLRNLDHGDRDSVGIFQQRPSQGWGTPAQIQDPYYATNKFYDALVEVDGYRRMRITEAAQTVQRSGFPEAYEDHAADARALASALTGNSPATFSCVVRGAGDLEEETTGPRGLTPRAAAVRRTLLRAFGDVPLGGFAPGGVRTGHMEGSAHYDGRALDAFVRPVTDENRRRGWAMASYLVAHAARLHVEHVIFDGRIWSERRSSSGWRDYDPGGRAGNRVVLEHRDHVHVDVAAGG
ncbi:MAG TPA: hypothetical protein VER39_02435 [Nocardioidaceae bacterium]|nr:hypothetical protein [Nocardioidaceae bacterium]